MSRSVVANRVRRGFYLDSVALMRLSVSLSEGEGVESASLMIGTPSNLEILDEAGLLTAEGRGAVPDDLVLAVRATGRDALEAALEAAAEALERAADPDEKADLRFPGLRSAFEALPGANLAIVSVPGPFAAREARRALRCGLNVLLFSDHVSVEEEVALKREAGRRGLLVMGPDCGTAIIGGVPLAFANRVRRGDIGVVAASGTGLQEFSVLVHRGGGGISHGIGVGGRDLSDAVGAASTLAALDLLEADAATRHIAILSKPLGLRTEAALLARLAECPKPVTLCLVGWDEAALPANVRLAPTLRDAARLALAGGAPESVPECRTTHPTEGDARQWIPASAGMTEVAGRDAGVTGSSLQSALGHSGGSGNPRKTMRYGELRTSATPGAARAPLPAPRPGRIIGLFSGGTLCAEAQAILRRAGIEAASNAPIPGVARAARVETGGEGLPPDPRHLLLDLGADEYTSGRPHPMIEPAMRARALAQALADPGTAVVVLDVVLGTGCHPDPAAAITRALETAPVPHPVFVASVCGTDRDPQDAGAQTRTLERAGIFVAESNADAVEAALRIAGSCSGASGTRLADSR